MIKTKKGVGLTMFNYNKKRKGDYGDKELREQTE